MLVPKTLSNLNDSTTSTHPQAIQHGDVRICLVFSCATPWSVSLHPSSVVCPLIQDLRLCPAHAHVHVHATIPPCPSQSHFIILHRILTHESLQVAGVSPYIDTKLKTKPHETTELDPNAPEYKQTYTKHQTPKESNALETVKRFR